MSAVENDLPVLAQFVGQVMYTGSGRFFLVRSWILVPGTSTCSGGRYLLVVRSGGWEGFLVVQ
jgi:hypothetical protein